MRRMLAAVIVLAGSALVAPSARAETRVQGVGGLTYGRSETASLFGGEISAGLGSHVELFGGAGYMRDTLSRNLLLDAIDLAEPFTGVGVRLAGLYGEGGLRLLTSPAPVRGYVEGSAGVVRLTPQVDLRSDRFDFAEPFVNAALDRIHWTEPLMGLGGGVIIQPGPVSIDLGYRYKRIFTGTPIDVNQLRAAVGVRF